MMQSQDDQATRDAYQQSGGDPATLKALLYQGGAYKAAQAQEKFQLEGDKTRGEIAKNNAETFDKVMTAQRNQLANVNDPQAAALWLKSSYENPVLTKVMTGSVGPYEEAASRIPQDREGLANWVQQYALGATKFIEMNKPNIHMQDTGGASNIVAVPGLGGAPQVLSTTNKTQTPDSVASNATAIRGQNMVDARKREELQGAETQFTPGAIKNAAARYNIDGTLPPMGMGKAGSMGRSAILNEAAIQAQSSGLSGDEQRIQQIGNKANTAALSKLQQQQTMVGAFERNFNMNADLALGMSQKTGIDGIPIASKWLQAGKRSVDGNPDISAYDVALKATTNEYAKIISGSMGNTAMAEGEIKKVEELLNAAQTPAQVQAVISFMKQETQNRMKGFQDEKAALRGSMSGKPSASAYGTDAAAPAAPSPGTVKVINGTTYVNQNGQWFQQN